MNNVMSAWHFQQIKQYDKHCIKYFMRFARKSFAVALYTSNQQNNVPSGSTDLKTRANFKTGFVANKVVT